MPNTAPQELIDWVNEQMALREWSIRETAKQAGISHAPISYLVNGETPSFDTCVALARAFGVPPENLLRLAGLLPSRSDHDETWDEIRAYYDEGDGDDRSLMRRIMREIIQEKRKREKQLAAHQQETVPVGGESGR